MCSKYYLDISYVYKRKLNTCDTSDFPIDDRGTNVIYAFSNSSTLQYHGPDNRGSVHINFIHVRHFPLRLFSCFPSRAFPSLPFRSVPFFLFFHFLSLPLSLLPLPHPLFYSPLCSSIDLTLSVSLFCRSRTFQIFPPRPSCRTSMCPTGRFPLSKPLTFACTTTSLSPREFLQTALILLTIYTRTGSTTSSLVSRLLRIPPTFTT